ncbi:hypothetical protein RhiJN_24699 [Ceratobasidium sp. AG-Ba]|nr:hypothetical protein RhiJN_24699 [Ceratobasidium sp. AG-Ba]
MSDYRRAAANLSQAAGALSSAAQAMAKAASSLQSTTQTLARYANNPDGTRVVLMKQPKPVASPITNIHSTDNHDHKASTMTRENQYVETAPVESLPKATQPTSDETTPPAPSIPTIIPAKTTSLVQGYSSSPSEAGSRSPVQARSRRHIMLNNESEVLIAACCLAKKFNLVACYLPITSLVSVPLYEQLFSQVLDYPVGTIQTTTNLPKAQAEVTDFFNGHARGMLLLPESIIAEMDVNPLISSCVIHVGWPSRQENYESQVTEHNMQHSVLVAFGEDAEIYPGGPSILSQGEEWPSFQSILSTDVLALSPQFHKILSKLSSRTKERIYPVGNGSQTMVLGAVATLNPDVLGYQPEESTNESEVRLPHVSAGFIAHNRLEGAVEDGVLNAGSTSALSGDGALPGDAIPLNDSSTTDEKHKTSTPTPEPSRVYIVLDSDFDLYPFLLNLVSPNDVSIKAVCFVKELMVVNFLIDQLKEVAKVPVVVALSQSEAKLQQAAEEFHSTERGLLFWGAYTQPHPSLALGRIDHVVHIGWIIDSQLRNHQMELARASTVILGRSEYSSMDGGRKLLQSEGLFGSQKATALNKRGDGAQLDDVRKAWRACLAKTPTRTLRNCYTHWMMYYFAGKHKVPGWTAIDLVKAANNFARKTLLRGVDDGDTFEQAVGGPLPVTQGLVDHLGLQTAQQAGLLVVDP